MRRHLRNEHRLSKNRRKKVRGKILPILFIFNLNDVTIHVL
jgi:hypothetical protein